MDRIFIHIQLISLVVIGIVVADPGEVHQLRNGQFVEIIEENHLNGTEKAERADKPEKLEKPEKPEKRDE